MSPDIPLKIVEWFFLFDVLGVLVGLMLLYAIFLGWYYYKLLSGEPEKHTAIFDQAKQLIRSEHWGTRYRLFLHRILAKLTGVIGDYYRFPDKKPVFRHGFPIETKIQDSDTLRRIFGVNPLTVESYQFCFLLALLYPIFGFLLGWSMGGSGTLNTMELLPAETPLLSRLVFFLTLSVSISLAVWSRKLTGWRFALAVAVAIAIATVGTTFTGDTVSTAGTSAVAFVGAVAGAGSFAFAVPSAFPVPGAVALAFAVAFAFAFAAAFAAAFAVAFPVAVALVFAFAFAVFISIAWLYGKAIQKKRLATYWYIYSLFFFTGSLAILVWVDNTAAVSLLLFYLILPLANTPLDWLSLGITRALLQSIRFNQHRFRKALVWGALDLGLALIALLLVSGVTVSVISLANLLAIKPIIDLQALFNSLASLDNWKDNLWIYFMLLSTLIPTAVHFSLVGGALTLSVSNKKRADILKDFETNDHSAKKAWIYVSLMPAFGFVLAPTLLLYGLYQLLHSFGASLGNSLLEWAKMLATAIDPTLGQ